MTDQYVWIPPDKAKDYLKRMGNSDLTAKQLVDLSCKGHFFKSDAEKSHGIDLDTLTSNIGYVCDITQSNVKEAIEGLERDDRRNYEIKIETRDNARKKREQHITQKRLNIERPEYYQKQAVAEQHRRSQELLSNKAENLKSLESIINNPISSSCELQAAQAEYQRIQNIHQLPKKSTSASSIEPINNSESYSLGYIKLLIASLIVVSLGILNINLHTNDSNDDYEKTTIYRNFEEKLLIDPGGDRGIGTLISKSVDNIDSFSSSGRMILENGEYKIIVQFQRNENRKSYLLTFYKKSLGIGSLIYNKINGDREVYTNPTIDGKNDPLLIDEALTKGFIKIFYK